MLTLLVLIYSKQMKYYDNAKLKCLCRELQSRIDASLSDITIVYSIIQVKVYYDLDLKLELKKIIFTTRSKMLNN